MRIRPTRHPFPSAMMCCGLIALLASDVLADPIYFNSPTQSTMNGTVLQAGGIYRLDGAGGTPVPILTGLHYPSGIVPDGSGGFYFGDVSFGPFTIQILRQRPGMPATSLGPALTTTSGGSSSIDGWGFDMAQNAGGLYFNSPQLVRQDQTVVQPGSIQRIDLTTGTRSTVVSNLHHPGGLAFDSAGDLFFGDVADEPLRANLLELTSAGTLTTLATAFDSSAGGVTIGGWGFSVAAFDHSVYFTRPTIKTFSGTVLQTGSIEQIDLTTGAQRTFVPNLHYPTGLSFDAAGNLFFGDVTYGPLSCELMERQASGSLVPLGQIPGVSTSFISIGGWAFDTVAQVPEPVAGPATLLTLIALVSRRRHPT